MTRKSNGGERAWTALMKSALVGLERIPLPIEIIKELERQNIEVSNEPVRNLLSAIASEALLQKAQLPTVTTNKLPEIPVESKPSQAGNPLLETIITSILEGPYDDVFPEFLQLLKINQQLIPPIALPAILNKAVLSSKVWVKVEPILGNTGRWLIRQNPAWSSLLPAPKEVSWESATVEERLLLLASLRKGKPSKAVALLESIWAEEKWKNKLLYLNTLDEGLSGEDEPFLNRCLKDSRKEIRLLAAELLSALPGSEWQTKAVDKISEFIEMKKGRLQVSFPEADDKKLKALGFTGKSFFPDFSLRQALFAEVFSKIPVSRMESVLKINYEKCLDLFFRSEEKKVLLAANLSSLILHFDAGKATIFLNKIIDHADEGILENHALPAFIEKLPEHVFHGAIMESLERTESLPEKKSLLYLLIKHSPHLWNKRFSEMFLTVAETTFTHGRQPWNSWEYINLFRMAAVKLHPQLIVRTLNLLENSNAQTGNFFQMEGILDVLNFRKSMYQAFQKVQ